MSTRTCSYCLDEIDINEGTHASLMCGHTFHEACIDGDFHTGLHRGITNVRCPICKRDASAMATIENQTLGATSHSEHPTPGVDLTVPSIPPIPASWTADILPPGDLASHTSVPSESSGLGDSGSVGADASTGAVRASVDAFRNCPWRSRASSEAVPAETALDAVGTSSEVAETASAEVGTLSVCVPVGAAPGAVGTSREVVPPGAASGEVGTSSEVVPGNAALGEVGASSAATLPHEATPGAMGTSMEAVPAAAVQGLKRAASVSELALLDANDGTEFALPKLQRAASEGFQINSLPVWQTLECDLRVTCLDFGAICTKFRVLSKTQGTFRCNKCCYVHARLWRDGGSAEVDELEGHDRNNWFKQAQSANARGQRHLQNQQSSKVQHRRYELGGIFKPLSVWVSMSYDGEAIATKSLPENVQPSDMFGLVYRVPELFVGAGGMDEVVNFDAPVRDVVQSVVPAGTVVLRRGSRGKKRGAEDVASGSANPPTIDPPTIGPPTIDPPTIDPPPADDSDASLSTSSS